METTQAINCTAYDLNSKLLVTYSSYGLNNKPFDEHFWPFKYRTNLLFRSPLYLVFSKYLKKITHCWYSLVQYSDPYCKESGLDTNLPPGQKK